MNPNPPISRLFTKLKLIVDLLYEGGLSWMRYSVSDTAEYGDYTRGPRIITDESRAEMKRVLSEIQSGAFAREWMAQAREGAPYLLEQRAANRSHPIEKIGRELRQMMPLFGTQGAGNEIQRLPDLGQTSRQGLAGR